MLILCLNIWRAQGDHVLIAEEDASDTHLVLVFEPLSRTYELTVVGQSGARVDGYDYSRRATVRLGSGSCVRVGKQEFCVLLPQLPRGAPPPSRPLPALPGAGGPGPPPLPLVAIAVQALREAQGHVLSLGEIEHFIRRAYPHVANTTVGARACKTWRVALEAELRARPSVCTSRDRRTSELGSGPVWLLSGEIAQSPPKVAAQQMGQAPAQQMMQASAQQMMHPSQAQQHAQRRLAPAGVTQQQQQQMMMMAAAAAAGMTPQAMAQPQANMPNAMQAAMPRAMGPRGMAPQAMATQAMATQGMTAQGMTAHGVSPRGMPPQGLLHTTGALRQPVQQARPATAMAGFTQQMAAQLAQQMAATAQPGQQMARPPQPQQPQQPPQPPPPQ